MVGQACRGVGLRGTLMCAMHCISGPHALELDYRIIPKPRQKVKKGGKRHADGVAEMKL